jgi:hypothetical protein
MCNGLNYLREPYYASILDQSINACSLCLVRAGRSHANGSSRVSTYHMTDAGLRALATIAICWPRQSRTCRKNTHRAGCMGSGLGSLDELRLYARTSALDDTTLPGWYGSGLMNRRIQSKVTHPFLQIGSLIADSRRIATSPFVQAIVRSRSRECWLAQGLNHLAQILMKMNLIRHRHRFRLA